MVNLVDAAQNVVNGYYAQSQAGKLNEADAQREALARLATMRYGDAGYLFVIDSKPVVLMHPTLPQMIAATAVGAVMSYGAVSLPGEVSFISSIAPIALALGVPIAPLGLLVAVEMIPDIFRTVGNVTLDVALAAVVDKSAGNSPKS